MKTIDSVLINIVLGFIQGVTEWLPVSSDGHLAVAEHFFGIKNALPYDVFLHVATLVVIVIYFRNDLLRLVRSLGDPSAREDRKMIMYIVVVTIITAACALLLLPLVALMRDDMRLLAAGFGVTALVVGLSAVGHGNKALSWPVVICMAFAQSLAVLPAVSRSGLTIGIALLLGVGRETAFRFSFLMAIPAIVAAFVFVLPDMEWHASYVPGFVVTFFVGYGALMLLQRIVRKGQFHFFALYTIVVALALALYA